MVKLNSISFDELRSGKNFDLIDSLQLNDSIKVVEYDESFVISDIFEVDDNTTILSFDACEMYFIIAKNKLNNQYCVSESNLSELDTVDYSGSIGVE